MYIFLYKNCTFYNVNYDIRSLCFIAVKGQYPHHLTKTEAVALHEKYCFMGWKHLNI